MASERRRKEYLWEPYSAGADSSRAHFSCLQDAIKYLYGEKIVERVAQALSATVYQKMSGHFQVLDYVLTCIRIILGRHRAEFTYYIASKSTWLDTLNRVV